MKIAIPVFNGYISPRIDCTRMMVSFEVSDGEATGREEILLPTMHPLRIPEFLKSKVIETIICGGIPHPVLVAAQQQGLSVIYGVIGELDEVVEAFLNGTLKTNLNFCFERRCGRRRGRRGQGRKFGKGGRN